MSEAVRIRVEPRDAQKNKGTGTRVARRLRKSGRIPAVIYGHKQAVVPVTLSPRRRLADDQDAGTPGRARPGRHDRDRADPRRPVGPPGQGDPPPRLRPGQRRGDRSRPKCRWSSGGMPPGSRPAGSSSSWSTACAIKCRAGAIPDSIKVDVSDLQVDQGVHVRDLKLPPDVTVNADPDMLLVHVVTRAAEPEPGRGGRRDARPSPRSSSPSARKKRRKIDLDRVGSPGPGRGANRSRAAARSGRPGRVPVRVRRVGRSPGVGDVETGGRPGQPGQQVPGDAAQHRLRGDRPPGPGRERGRRSPASSTAWLAETEIDFRRVLLLKPETFMNLSGRSVGQAMRFYKLDPADLLVVCDDLSLPLGKLRIRPGGSDGGQKGLRDITAHLGTDQFPRLRIGIGERGDSRRRRLRPQPVPQRRTTDHRRRPDPRHPGRRRLGHPGDRCRDESVQRSGKWLVASGQ